MHVSSVGRVSVTAQTSLPTSEFTLETDPMNAGSVGKASVRAPVSSSTGESTPERNPTSVLNVAECGRRFNNSSHFSAHQRSHVIEARSVVGMSLKHQV